VQVSPTPTPKGVFAVPVSELYTTHSTAPPRTRSLAEVCEIIGCDSEDWVLDRVRSGLFPARRIVRQVRFTDADIAAILDACAYDTRQAAVADLPTPNRRRRVEGAA
jgi:hypothetical protein